MPSYCFFQNFTWKHTTTRGKHYRPCPVSGYPQVPTWPSSLPVTRKPVAKLHTARCTTSRCMKLLKADPPSRFQSNLGTSKPLEPPKHEGELQTLHRNWLIKSYEYQWLEPMKENVCWFHTTVIRTRGVFLSAQSQAVQNISGWIFETNMKKTKTWSKEGANIQI